MVGRYLRTCERARTLVAAGGLDDVVTTPWGAEVNADIIREAIDGPTGH